MRVLQQFRTILPTLFAMVVFATTVHLMKPVPRLTVKAEIQVTLPLFAQVLLGMGDRYVAADMAAIRALVADPHSMRPEEFAALARVQQDVSWLNPGHEDNYYVAAAMLPWYGEVDAAQYVLARASRARRFDYQPALYYAFNQMHFRHDPVSAAEWLNEAAAFLPEGGNRIQMQHLASLWIARSPDLDVAIQMVDNLAKQAQRRDFQRYLEIRATRLRGLKDLRVAAEQYRAAHQRNPGTLNDLVKAGFLSALPADPSGLGYVLEPSGEIRLRNFRERQAK